jgi:ketosteroid isomerase-like protein
LATEELLQRAAQALAACDVDAIMTLYADDGVFEDASAGESYRGKAAVRGMFEALFSPPHTRFRIAAVRSGERWGALEWIWSGRTRKSGTPFDVRGVSILEIPGPKVVKETIYYDPAPALV